MIDIDVMPERNYISWDELRKLGSHHYLELEFPDGRRFTCLVYIDNRHWTIISLRDSKDVWTCRGGDPVFKITRKFENVSISLS